MHEIIGTCAYLWHLRDIIIAGTCVYSIVNKFGVCLAFLLLCAVMLGIHADHIISAVGCAVWQAYLFSK